MGPVIPGRLEEPNYGAHCAPENLEIPGSTLTRRPGMTTRCYFTAWMRSQSALR
jgi:hypothetical protein